MKDAAGVDDILAGGAPVHEVGGLLVFFCYESSEVLDERNRNVSGASGGLRERGGVKEFGAAFGGDCGGRRGGDNADAGLGASQGDLEIKHSLERGAIRKEIVDRGRAEEGIEKIHAMSVIIPGRQRKRFRRASDATQFQPRRN